MIKTININERIEFISQFDTTEPKTVFVFRPLSGLEMIKLSEGSLDIERFLNAAILEIKGVEDKAAFIKTLEAKVLGELVNKANEVCEITKAEIKN